MSKTHTKEESTERLAVLDAAESVHDALGGFTPPEALDVLKIVRANLRAEIQDMNVTLDSTLLKKWLRERELQRKRDDHTPQFYQP